MLLSKKTKNINLNFVIKFSKYEKKNKPKKKGQNYLYSIRIEINLTIFHSINSQHWPLIFITCCNCFPKFLMRFEQIFSGISFILQWLYILILAGFLVTDDLFKLSILTIDFKRGFKSRLIKGHGRTNLLFLKPYSHQFRDMVGIIILVL